MALNVISGAEFKDKIKFGLSGAYLFFGEEEFMKHHYLVSARNAVLGGDDVFFRHKKISCAEFDTEKMTDALTTSAMGFFEGKTLCELHEIQFNSLKEAEWRALIDMLSNVSPDVVAIIYTTPDEFDGGNLPKMPSKALTRMGEVVIPVYFPREGELKLAKWVAKHFMSEKLTFENGVCEFLIERCGKDMYTLTGEIEKLCAYVKSCSRDKVEKADVTNICSHNMEINAFDFSNALLENNADRAYAILSDMKQRKEKPIMILSSVTKAVSEMYAVKMLSDGGMTDADISKKLKIHTYRVGLYKKSTQRRRPERLSAILRLCTETDIKLKSTSMEDYTEIDKLVIILTSVGK